MTCHLRQNERTQSRGKKVKGEINHSVQEEEGAGLHLAQVAPAGSALAAHLCQSREVGEARICVSLRDGVCVGSFLRPVAPSPCATTRRCVCSVTVETP